MDNFLFFRMASRVIPLDTQLRVPLTNGIGRYVCQLQRLTLTFCKERSDSNGMRYIFYYANDSYVFFIN